MWLKTGIQLKNIVLIGFMGSGKTAVGKLLAERLGYKFIDTDEIIERSEGKTISALFNEEGEQRFREIEARIVRELFGLKRHVISTGGGIVTNKENISNLKKGGLIVWLKAAPETIYNRVSSKTHRPLLNVEDPLETIKKLLTFREPFYAEADVSVDTDGLDVEKIVEVIIKAYDKMSEVRSQK